MESIKFQNQITKFEFVTQGMIQGPKTVDRFLQLHKIYDKNKNKIIEYKKDYDWLNLKQKPVLLLEDLIKTFSNENDLVVDLTMGSGSTGVACLNTNRKFIGIEMDEKYFEIAEKRISEAKHKLF